MIVASLGYTAETLPGAWPGAFVNKARGLGILDICSTTGNAAAPRQDIACFLYKALTAQIGYVDKDGTWHPNEGKDGDDDTMLNRLGATKYDGGNGAGKPFVLTDKDDAEINVKNYLGAYVSAYADKDGKKIIAIKEVKSQFVTGTAEDILDDYTVTDTAAVFIQNGEAELNTEKDATTKYVTKTLAAIKADKDLKDLELKVAVDLSGKKIKEVYSIQTWVEKETFQVDDTEAIQDEIADDHELNNNPFIEDDNEEIDMTSFELVGKDALADIKEDDVVTVYVNKAGELVKIEVSDKTVEGKITKISTDKATYTIAGEAYDLHDDINTEANQKKLDGIMTAKETYTYYLTYAGTIFAFEEVEGETTTNYAVILKSDVDSGALFEDPAAYVRLLLADGTTKDFAVKDSIKSTGDGAEISTKVGDWDKKPVGGELIKYTLNSDDVITEIVTAAAPAKAVFDENGIANKTALKDSTVVFSLVDKGDKTDKDDYEILKAADLFDTTVDKTSFIADGGDFKAVLVEGFTTADDIYAVFVKDSGKGVDGEVFNVLYDGALVDMTVDLSKATATEVYTTGKGLVFTLTRNASDVVTNAKKADTTKMVETELAPTKAGSVSGNVFTYDGSNYSFVADAPVYVKDGSSWNKTAEKISALKSAKTYDSIILIDVDGDGKYDLALAYK